MSATRKPPREPQFPPVPPCPEPMFGATPSRMLYFERVEGWYALFSLDGVPRTMPLYQGTFREISDGKVHEMVEQWVIFDDGTPKLLGSIGNFEYFTQTPRGPSC